VSPAPGPQPDVPSGDDGVARSAGDVDEATYVRVAEGGVSPAPRPQPAVPSGGDGLARTGGPAHAAGGDQERVARAALCRLVEPGDHRLAALLTRYGAAGALDRLRSGGADAKLTADLAPRLARGDPLDVAVADLDRADRLGARLVIPGDPEWPDGRLADLARIATDPEPDVFPPICLWVRGPHDLARVTERSVAVVGARAATGYGVHVAGELGFGLAECGWAVLSGGAYGIDAAAHRGCLAAGGVTVAVLASGLDAPYPVGNTALFERIGEEGLLVSEWPPGTTPRRHRFLVRNRVIAALAVGTVVVEAAHRSGSRMTARRAAELSRVTMAVPGPVTSALSVGCHTMIRDLGASLVTSVNDVVELVGRIGEFAPDPVAPGAPPASGAVDPHALRDQLDPLSARVLEAVPVRRPAAPFRIAAEAGLAASVVRRALPVLVTLELVDDVDGEYRLAPELRAATTGRQPSRAPPPG
jgi:DNA processing protein